MDTLPEDLAPLPTQPWDERPASIPLDVEECRTALWRCRGNVTTAAALIKVPASRLRQMVAKSPYLTREMNEARQMLADIAEDVAYEALTDESDKGRRDSMARFILDRIGKDRGYSTGSGGKLAVNTNGGAVTIVWADGPMGGSEPEPEPEMRVINGE